jgi:hypothetical protein
MEAYIDEILRSSGKRDPIPFGLMHFIDVPVISALGNVIMYSVGWLHVIAIIIRKRRVPDIADDLRAHLY